jgi:hypothetical protein
MKKPTKASRNGSSTSVIALRESPVHGIKPRNEHPVVIDLDAIDIDPTNPGGVTESLRYKRRQPSIRDSYDILAQIIYPVIVCEHPEDDTRYIHVDGFGRITEARARGQKQICAIVFPSLTLEQRICLRQTLGAAQEPFDVASIIRDLQELARTRKIDLNNPEQIKTLVRDLPEKVRKHEKDLVMLARWHPDAVDSLGETYRKEGTAIGIDKIRGMDRILRILETRHPQTLEKLGGQQTMSLKLAKMYVAKKFSEGTRSQEAIRRVAQTFDAALENDPAILDFLANEKSYSELPKVPTNGAASESSVVHLCKQLMAVLADLETDSLTPAARRTLERTDAVLDQVLKAEAV